MWLFGYRFGHGCHRGHDIRQAVGDRSLPSLLAVLQYDAPQDGDIAKAVLETLMGVLEVGEKVSLILGPVSGRLEGHLHLLEADVRVC